jgi:hypothetical protein
MLDSMQGSASDTKSVFVITAIELKLKATTSRRIAVPSLKFGSE